MSTAFRVAGRGTKRRAARTRQGAGIAPDAGLLGDRDLECPALVFQLGMLEPEREALRMEGRTVLLVGDETREALRALLDRSGYRVREAASAAEGLRAAQAERPDLLIADAACALPDGSALPHCLKGDPRTASVPLLLVIAGASVGAEDALRCECDGIFRPPIWPLLAQDVVRRLIGPAQAA